MFNTWACMKEGGVCEGPRDKEERRRQAPLCYLLTTIREKGISNWLLLEITQ